MQSLSAEMAKNTGKIAEPKEAMTGTLDQRYRQIGIPAVAAAVRYQSITKNPAYAPVVANWDNRIIEAA